MLKNIIFSYEEMLSGASYSVALSPVVENKQARYLFKWNTKEKVWEALRFFQFYFLNFLLFYSLLGEILYPKIWKDSSGFFFRVDS